MIELNVKTVEFKNDGGDSDFEQGPVKSEFDGVSDIEGDDASMTFMTEMEKERIAEMWGQMVNMNNERMEMWDEHPCADAGVDGGENTRDETLMLLGQWPDGWDSNSYWIANKHLTHISEAMDGEEPDNPMEGGPGSCPSRWAINLLNRGVNPFDQMPGGNPEFTKKTTALNFESAAGVTWDSTKGGKLTESEIPNDSYEDHYMYAEDTKSDSSYPVVDGDGNLRSGNVSSAWDLGGQGAPVSAEEHDSRVRELAKAFDDPPIPDEEMEMALDQQRELLFEVDQEELDETYSEWSDAVNMTASQLERWGEHPCSDEGSKDPQAVRDRNMRLLEKDKSEWTQKDIDDGKRTVSFISRMSSSENKPENPKSGNTGTCPSEWAISLLNWAYNPFDGMPDGDPQGTQENSQDLNLQDSAITFAASAIRPDRPDLSGFNEYGVRQNTEDGKLVSVDAVYEAMEPGEPENRNGVRITKDFLKNVANKDYSDSPPFMMDHDRSTLSQVGFVKDVWYDDTKEKLMVMARAYNVGSDIHDEVIKRLTFEPPTIPDGSLGFGDSYDYKENESGEIVLTDARIQEFSTTPFPAGYENGGLGVDYSDTSSEAAVVIDCR
jgi:hypothetical protein